MIQVGPHMRYKMCRTLVSMKGLDIVCMGDQGSSTHTI